MRCRLKEWSVPDERSESGREFQILGAAARNERKPKIRLVCGICKRLEEEVDVKTRERQKGIRRCKKYKVEYPDTFMNLYFYCACLFSSYTKTEITFYAHDIHVVVITSRSCLSMAR